MTRRKKHPEHANHERWLVSYADFITLLFAFFVVMFASSQADKGKAKQMSEAVAAALDKYGATHVAAVLGGAPAEKGKGNAAMKGPGGTSPPPAPENPPPKPGQELAPTMSKLVEDLKKEIQSGKMQVKLEPRGLVISLRDAAFFPSGTDVIAPALYPSLGKVAIAVSKLPNPIRVEGHTDAVPIHTERFRSNWELSSARGVAVLEALRDRFAVPEARMAIVAYADTAPVDSNETSEGRARNRRVDITVLNQQSAKREVPAVAQAAPPPHGPEPARTR